LFATGAWAQATLTQSTDTAFEASQLFGTGSTSIVLSPAASALDAAIVSVLVGDDDIGDGNVALMTFNVSNGDFAAIVPLSSISVTGGGLEGVAAFTKVGGGGAGDSSVTFRVEIVDTVSAGEGFVWAVPALTNVNLAGDPGEQVVDVVSTIEPTTTAPLPFPDTIDINACTDQSDCTIMVSASAYDNFTLDPFGDTGFVDIDDRAVIESGGTPIDTGVPLAPAVMGIQLGTIFIDAEIVAPLQRDGDDFSNAVGGDGVGSIVLTALGNFRFGDIVFIDLDDNDTIGPLESFTMTGGVATYTFPSIALALGEASSIYYVPNGVDDLQPETIAITASTSYALATNASDVAEGSAGFIQFDGIARNAYAYGVVKAGGVDKSFVRVTSESPSGSQLFFSCTDDAGVGSFGDAGFLPGSTTRAYSSDQIGVILGGVVFTGRGACDIFSDTKISVQHKIRSSDILTDNSVVIGQQIAFPSGGD
jgi:hypothetical protein